MRLEHSERLRFVVHTIFKYAVTLALHIYMCIPSRLPIGLQIQIRLIRSLVAYSANGDNN